MVKVVKMRKSKEFSKRTLTLKDGTKKDYYWKRKNVNWDIPKGLIKLIDRCIDGGNPFTREGYWNFYQFLEDAVKEQIKALEELECELGKVCGFLGEKETSPQIYGEVKGSMNSRYPSKGKATEIVPDLLPKWAIPRILRG